MSEQLALFSGTDCRQTGRYRGHRTFTDPHNDRILRYADGTAVDWNNPRPCAACGQHQTPEGYDPCLGFIRGAIGACCGHGREADAYVAFEGGGALYSEVADRYLKNNRKAGE